MFFQQIRTQIFLTAAGLTALTLSSNAIAIPFNAVDARSMAMGGTGTASAYPGAAPVFNPALLSHFDKDERAEIIVPNIGVTAFADPGAIDAFQDIDDENYIGNITTAIDNINAGDNFSSNRDIFIDNSLGLTRSLVDLSNKPFNFSGGVLFSAAIPDSNFGWAVYSTTDAIVETTPIISACDKTLLAKYAALASEWDSPSDIQPNVEITCPAGRRIQITDANAMLIDPKHDLSSSVFLAGVGISELGFSMAHAFETDAFRISIGFTPKAVFLKTYFSRPTVQELDDPNFDIGESLRSTTNTKSDFNLDAGLALDFFEDRSLTVGIVAKYLLPKSYRTATFRTAFGDVSTKFNLNTQTRVAVAWKGPLGITLASDIDLTRNAGYFTGIDTQYAGVGVEFDVVNILRIRTGFRGNLLDEGDAAATIGLGFNIVDVVHIDFGGQIGENNAGFATQLAINF
ncbi:Uncharacterised protein [BD1-7 clade bacterium]|uniref:Conjugal transfer protein TraF n=1 Tax=BD1-7 clade bacterium TaxID=2029982 RepID=A0A5S9QM02_9GAMM|nr:Uncharacterised protein [BD1-7 clade bacterium]